MPLKLISTTFITERDIRDTAVGRQQLRNGKPKFTSYELQLLFYYFINDLLLLLRSQAARRYDIHTKIALSCAQPKYSNGGRQ